MGFLNMLGFSAKAEETVAAAVSKPPMQFHPDALPTHRNVMISYLCGSEVYVMNPDTGSYELTPDPVFDPALRYVAGKPHTAIPSDAYLKLTTAAAHPIQDAAPPQPFTAQYSVAPAPVPPPPPPPPTAAKATVEFEPGEVWEDTQGRKFVILADKRAIIQDYDPSRDPDSGCIVVMRRDEGQKPAVSCRSISGSGRDGSRLTSKVGTVSMPLQRRVANKWFIYDRGDKYGKVHLCSSTGEVLLRG